MNLGEHKHSDCSSCHLSSSSFPFLLFLCFKKYLLVDGTYRYIVEGTTNRAGAKEASGPTGGRRDSWDQREVGSQETAVI